MTTALIARISPKPTNNIASFDCKLRDKIASYFGAESTYPSSVAIINGSALPYLYGLKDASTDKYDLEGLSNIIDALENGETVEIWKES